jgi:quercetin dioxygenase-like cupin family protein
LLYSLHSHKEAEIYYIPSGDGIVTVQGSAFNVEAGSMLYIPGNAVHGVKNLGSAELRWIYFFPTSDFRSIVDNFQGGEHWTAAGER